MRFQGLYDRAQEPLLEAACWAHARRNFFEIHAATDSPVALEPWSASAPSIRSKRRSGPNHPIQPRRAVHSMHSLVVPRMPI
mgnify:CR=1 FL=1